MYLYTEQELDEYESAVEKFFGSYNEVFHELVSPDIHLDVIIVPPTEEHPFYKLVTMGAGAYRMNVPKKFKKFHLEHAEYVIFLPAEWNIRSSDEKDYWPIRNLKSVARLPITCDTWVGFGHTIQMTAEGLPFAENTKFNCMLAFDALDLCGNEIKLKLSSGKIINFYQLIPIYPEELQFKKENRSDALLEKISADESFPIIDIERKNYAL